MSFIPGFGYDQPASKFIRRMLKVKKFTTESAALTFISGLDLSLVDEIYQGVKRFSELLYDALDDITETLTECFPLDLTLPGTKICLRLYDAIGDPFDFRLPTLSVDATSFIKPIHIGIYWYVWYFQFSDIELQGSEALYYKIDGTYQQGDQWVPIHKALLSELAMDSVLFALIILGARALRELGLDSVSKSLMNKGLSSQLSIGLKTQLSDIHDTVDTLASSLATIVTKVDDIIEDLSNMESGELSTIINSLQEIKTLVGARLILT